MEVLTFPVRGGQGRGRHLFLDCRILHVPLSELLGIRIGLRMWLEPCRAIRGV